MLDSWNIWVLVSSHNHRPGKKQNNEIRQFSKHMQWPQFSLVPLVDLPWFILSVNLSFYCDINWLGQSDFA